MTKTWSSWKRFPDPASSDPVEAPIGPGVYEVRHTLTGRVIAFGSARNIARTLSVLNANGGIGLRFVRLFRRHTGVSRIVDLEYRTCAVSSRAEAKTIARRLLSLRQTARRQRLGVRLATRR